MKAPKLSSRANTRQEGGRKKGVSEGERGAVLAPRKRRVCIEAEGGGGREGEARPNPLDRPFRHERDGTVGGQMEP